MFNELKSKAALEAEKVVAAGEHVRRRVATLTSKSILESHRMGGELKAIVQSVCDGAARGVESELAAEADSRLREVIDGVVDGVTLSANAVGLAAEEAVASGQRFASEDLKRAEQGFRDLQGSLVETLSGLANGVQGAVGEQARQFKDHASSVARQAGPVFVRTLETLARNAPTIAGEATRAGVAGVKSGAGALFEEMGARLSQLGSRLESAGEGQRTGDRDGGR